MFKIKYTENINKRELKLNKQFNSCIKNEIPQISLKSTNKKIQNTTITTKTNILIQNSNNYSVSSQETKQNIKVQDKLTEKLNQNKRMSIAIQPKNNLIRSKSCVSPLLPKTFLKEIQKTSAERKINNFLEDLQKQLIKSNIIDQRALCSTIKKSKFLQIFSTLVQGLMKIQINYDSSNKKQLAFLRPLFDKLSDMIDESKRRQKIQNLKLRSYVYGKEYSKVHFNQDTSVYTLKLNDFSEQMQNLQQKLQQQRHKTQLLQKNYIERKIQYMQISQKYNTIYQKVIRQKQKLLDIEQQISQKSIFLKKINEQVDKITNFGQVQQQKKILKWVGQTYKKIQIQLCQYAQYLVNDNSLEEIVLDSATTKQDQAWLEEQVIKIVSISLKKPSTQLIEKITLLINIFMDKIRSYEKETIKQINNKNVCYAKFTELIGNWIETFQMKKQYLNGLRMEFVTEADFINKVISNIQILKKKESSGQSFNVLIQTLKKHWNKIQLNYKYCSSFY